MTRKEILALIVFGFAILSVIFGSIPLTIIVAATILGESIETAVKKKD